MDLLIEILEFNIIAAEENYIKYLKMFGEDYSLTNYFKGELSTFTRTLGNINKLK